MSTETPSIPGLRSLWPRGRPLRHLLQFLLLNHRLLPVVLRPPSVAGSIRTATVAKRQCKRTCRPKNALSPSPWRTQEDLLPVGGQGGGLSLSVVRAVQRASVFLPDRPIWRDFARCKGLPAETFYLESDKDVPAVRHAKAICAACPVTESCLEAAHRNREEGIWGGTTESERKLKRRKRRVPSAASG